MYVAKKKHPGMLTVPIFGFWHTEGFFFFFLHILVVFKISTGITCHLKKKSVYILKDHLASILDQMGKFQLHLLLVC